jgi:hypothetical protein
MTTHLPPSDPAAPKLTPGVDDLKITVDKLAAIRDGHAVVTVKFSAPADMFDRPMALWPGIVMAEANRRHNAERCRRAIALDDGLRARGL